MTLPGTSERVPSNTAQYINERIERMLMCNLEYYATHPDEIEGRLRELDREWDIERTLETQAASLSLAGIILGTTVSKKWFVLPGIVGGFLLQHALQGWCPPVPMLRRLGVRTESEIEKERYALKALRGDFKNIHANGSPARQIMEAISRKVRDIKDKAQEMMGTKHSSETAPFNPAIERATGATLESLLSKEPGGTKPGDEMAA